MGVRTVKNTWNTYADHMELCIDNPTYGIVNIKIDLDDYERCRGYHWNIQITRYINITLRIFT